MPERDLVNINTPAFLSNGWDNYHQLWVPAVKEKLIGRARGGLAIFADKAVTPCSVITTNESWIFSEMAFGDLKCIVGSVYISPSVDFQQFLTDFERTLSEICSKGDENLIIIGGDFNCWVAELNSWPEEALSDTNLFPCRKSQHKKVNGRGELLLELMENHNFVLLNGRTDGDYPGNFTYLSSAGASVVDLVWVCYPECHLISNLVINHDVTLSDHFPVSVSVLLPSNLNSVDDIAFSRSKRLNWCDEKAADYQLSLENSPSVSVNFPTASVDLIYDNLLCTIRNCDFELGMFKIITFPPPKRKKSAKWYDVECANSQLMVDNLYKCLLSSNFDGTIRLEFVAARKKHYNLLKF